MKSSTHRQPILLTRRGKNLLNGLIVWGLAFALGIPAGLLIYDWFTP